MASVLRISEAGALALHAMVLLANEDGNPRTTAELASSLTASEAHLSKVLQRLAKAGLVRSTTGPKGGFVIVPKARNATLLRIYEAIDGQLVSHACLFERSPWGGHDCILGDLLDSINRQVRERLSKTKLSDAAAGCGDR